MGNPISPIGDFIVPNVLPTAWNLVATAPSYAGQFRFIFYTLSYYYMLNSFMAFRIQESKKNGRFWGVHTLATNAKIELSGAGNANQHWILELVA